MRGGAKRQRGIGSLRQEAAETGQRRKPDSGSALACCGSGVTVEFGGDRTSPVFLRLGIAKLGFEVQAGEGMEYVVGQERYPQEGLDGLGLVFPG